MSNIFWATFFGASLGLFSVNAVQAVIDDYRARQRRKSISILLEELEDFEADDEED
jgi:hypothetical protein